MTEQAIIRDKFKADKPIFSAEFYPPKSVDTAGQILETAQALTGYNLDFVSITYGAGGSTRERTLQYGLLLKDKFGYNVMPHLTCVGHSRKELHGIIKELRENGFRNIMALRGDPPSGETSFQAHPNGFSYATDLVKFIQREFPDICIGVGGYPEKHPEATSFDIDLSHLKEKIDAGSDFITTQLFFNNQDYLHFVDRCREIGITVPILPGILPAISYAQAKRFCSFCQASIPKALLDELEFNQGNDAASIEVGVNWAYKQTQELLEKGAPGIHLYLLNRAKSALKLLDRLQ